MKWSEAVLFFKFLAGGIAVLSGVATLWLTFDLPQVASKEYVDKKFVVAFDTSRQIQAILIDTRLQINRMTRQGLEGEKYRLEEQNKKAPDFELQKRINDINIELDDNTKERGNLQKLKFQ